MGRGRGPPRSGGRVRGYAPHRITLDRAGTPAGAVPPHPPKPAAWAPPSPYGRRVGRMGEGSSYSAACFGA
ncbi:hypothetical protein DMC25_16910 [Caulobacter sp. D4A]|nr:hypothetical protein DMC25_16910 [Caulobacter sp. D4A]PXA85663.1 hypothetical protein DMC18_22735 [Caulobacter sp. D5]